MWKMGKRLYKLFFRGNDLIITSSYDKHRLEVIKAVEEGRIEEALIDSAVKRIFSMKLKYGVMSMENF